MISAEINEIKERFLKAVNPKQIYLFGSYARGDAHSDSDYDFYLLFEDNAGDGIKLTQDAYYALRGFRNKPVDIVVGFESRFNERVKANTLEKRVLREGVLIYAQ